MTSTVGPHFSRTALGVSDLLASTWGQIDYYTFKLLLARPSAPPPPCLPSGRKTKAAAAVLIARLDHFFEDSVENRYVFSLVDVVMKNNYFMSKLSYYL